MYYHAEIIVLDHNFTHNITVHQLIIYLAKHALIIMNRYLDSYK